MVGDYSAFLANALSVLQDIGVNVLESLATQLAKLPEPLRVKVLDGMTAEELERLTYDWEFWARENQVPPEGDWTYWLIMAGRGWGKTRTGAEWVSKHAEDGTFGNFHLVGATADDARGVMIEGESGIMNIGKPWFRPKYYPTRKVVEWPNGATGKIFSADEPERLRGPQCDAAWCDELAAWRYAEAWEQLTYGLRLGKKPQVIITTTPRPTPLIVNLVNNERTHVTKGTTYDNLANLAENFATEIVNKYEGTRMGRQELLAELLLDSPGALWRRDWIDGERVGQSRVPTMKRMVVAIDPAVSFGERSDETGIVVAGLGVDGHGYVFDDLSGRMKPEDWSKRALDAYSRYEADRVIAEINQGGAMVEYTMRVLDENVSYKGVHAKKSKVIRAEPVAALYEQRKVHHVGMFPTLEDQLCSWEQGQDSPDRLDALVYALTELMIGKHTTKTVMMAPNDLKKTSFWRTVT